jgi:DNA (cytosine-5)-methyltransferase 1
MVGNAIPPLFAYFAAHAFLGTSAADLLGIEDAAVKLTAPSPKPDVTSVDTAGAKFPEDRTFRFAIPSLRLKSGVRFELGNQGVVGARQWRVAFWFGTSKDIKGLNLGPDLADWVLEALPAAAQTTLAEPIRALETMLEEADLQNMQKLWSHRGPGRTRPFMLLDGLDEAGRFIQDVLAPFETSARGILKDVISRQYGSTADKLPGLAKLDRNAGVIVAGVIVGSLANLHLDRIIDTTKLKPCGRAHST